MVAGNIEDVSEGNDALTVFDKSSSLKVGDTIQLEHTELTVVGVLKDSPFLCSACLFMVSLLSLPR